MEKQLKSYEHYNKRYDRLVITTLKKKENEESKHKKGSAHYSLEQEIKSIVFSINKQSILDDRDESIKKWMENDRIYDKRIALSPPIAHLGCVKCENGMTALDSDIKNDGRILYLYRCISDKCKSVRSIYTDGEEYVTKKKKCPKCFDILKFKEETTEEVRLFTDYCPTCDYSDSIDFPINKKKRDCN